MDGIRIEPLRGHEVDAVVDLWNRAAPADGITRDRLESRTLLDPRFALDDFQVARAEADRPLGFLIGNCPRDPVPGVDPDGERAWITMFGVDPGHRRRGIGSALVEHALEGFRARGRRRVSVATYPYGYHMPGIDPETYPEAIALLERHGFERRVEAIAMDAPLVGYAMPAPAVEKENRLAADGIRVRAYRRDDWWEFLRFMAEGQPVDWLELARTDLREIAEWRRDPASITVAADPDGRIYGYCRHDAGHFGPFGVDPAHRGRGIGSALIGRMLEKMRRDDLHVAWLLWTEERAARLYARFGFRESRRFVVMERRMDGDGTE